MKRMLMIPVLTLAMATLSVAALAADPGFQLQRMVVAAAVEEREPVGEADLFSRQLERVFAFIETRRIERDTEVTFVWLRNDREVARIPLEIRQGNRWRTFSSITLANRPGDWRVELHDAAGNRLEAVEFIVQ